MDLQYIPGHTHSSDSGCLRSMWHGRHKHQGMGLGTCCLYMQDGWHILGWLCTHVCTLHRGRLAARANMCKMLHHSFPCTRHLYHKGWVCMGQLFLVEELWLKLIHKNLYGTFYGLTCWPPTLTERIPNEALITNTNWHMVSDTAVGIDAAQSGTRVLALAVDARLVRGTVGINNTLWSTVWRRANHFRKTWTLAPFSYYSGRVAIWSAWVRITRINVHRFYS